MFRYNKFISSPSTAWWFQYLQFFSDLICKKMFSRGFCLLTGCPQTSQTTTEFKLRNLFISSNEAMKTIEVRLNKPSKFPFLLIYSIKNMWCGEINVRIKSNIVQFTSIWTIWRKNTILLEYFFRRKIGKVSISNKFLVKITSIYRFASNILHVLNFEE